MGGKIFIEIVSYRDLELKRTIDSALSQAIHPEKLIFGIVHQYDEQTLRLLDEYRGDARFKIMEIDWCEARGVGFARALAEMLYVDEEWVLQIDSHMQFGKGWDMELIRQWQMCNDSKAVLSTYPAWYRYEKKRNVPFEEMIDSKMEFDRSIDMGCRYEMIPKRNLLWPMQPRCVKVPSRQRASLKRALCVAGGLEFFKGEALKDVKCVKDIEYNGEEIIRSAQFYTHGYNIYVPMVHIYHHYERVRVHRYKEDRANKKETLQKGRYDQFLAEEDSDTARKALLAGEEKRGYMGKERSLRTFLEIV